MAIIAEDFEDAGYAFPITGTWARSTVTPRAGSWCFKSGTIDHGATTDATITVPAGATTMRFWYRVSSESGFDFFRVLVGASTVLETSGTVAWTQSAEINVVGASQVTFRYTKDSSQVAGEDAAYIDDLSFTAPDPIRRNTFNGGTHGAAITTANSGSSGNPFDSVVASPQYSNLRAAGPSGLSVVNPTAGVDTHLDWIGVAQSGDVFCARLYMYVVGYPAGVQRVFVLLGSGNVFVSAVWLFPAGQIAVFVDYSSTQAIITTQVVPLGQWIRVELRYTINAGGSGTVELWQYFDADSTVETEYLSSATLTWPGGKPSAAEFHLQRDAGGYWHLDNPAVAGFKLGPAPYVRRGGETDTAQPVTGRKVRLIGQALEADLARPVTRRKVRFVGQAAETDTAQPVRVLKARLLGQAAEADAAYEILPKSGTPVRPAAELDLAQPISGRKVRLLGQAIETDLAQLIATQKVRLLGQAIEIDRAEPIRGRSTVRPAAETDLARPITGRKVRLIGQAAETGTARPINAQKARLLSPAPELDLVQPVIQRKVRVVGPAAEVDIARPVRAAGLGQVAEVDLALPITGLQYQPRPMKACPPRIAWSAVSPRTRWSAGSPRM
ncbi:hypothetical protein SAMN05421505_14916 [Sinosporangium album]|uniref:Uncharacterized protein n=1 Tax=Sinosporangium album TaxID=504805 RepID=A0A1G8KB93_9ACTN|nr:hypothetical protein [Sinosporangium album]SDI40694.1 hypothetical protein SAMN05421505_14916 [Sinosporangium album]